MCISEPSFVVGVEMLASYPCSQPYLISMEFSSSESDSVSVTEWEWDTYWKIKIKNQMILYFGCTSLLPPCMVHVVSKSLLKN